MLPSFLRTLTLSLSLSFPHLTTSQNATQQPWTNWTSTGLSDRSSIQQTLALYAIAVDTKTWSLFTEVFTTNATATYDATTPVITGLSQIQTYLIGTLVNKTSQHLLGTQLINIVGNGSSADATTYVQATLAADPRLTDGQVVMLYGFYNDVLVKTGEGWRIDSRVFRLYGPGIVGNSSLLG